MKYFWLPAALLALLAGLSLWNASEMNGCIEPWCEALSEASEAASHGEWDAAERAVRETREAWQARHPYLHIVTAHDELDDADGLFAAAESYAAERDAAEFRSALAQLAAQLRVVSEMQKLTVKNVL